MNKFSKKTELLRIVDDRANMMIADTNTFIWLRHNHPDELRKNKEIGGGNLLMALGLFSALNLMAKVHKILRKGKGCIVQKADVQEFRSIVKKYPELKGKIQPLAVGQVINEEDAFVKLIKDSNAKFGLSDEGLRAAWQSFRNYLSHTATIRPGHSSVTFQIKSRNFEQFIEKENNRKRPVFGFNQHGLRFYPDTLNIEVRYIRDWLLNKIKEEYFTNDKIEDAFDWVQDWID
jgi:hypothetical protein